MKHGATVLQPVTALHARTQFGQIMRRATQNRERFVVDRRGQPQVVIMGIQDFLKTIAPEPELLAHIRAAAKKNGTAGMSMREINREIKAARKELKRSGANQRRS